MSDGPQSIRVGGEGPFMHMYFSHGMKRFPDTTFYDGSAAVRKFRLQEVKLGLDGYLDAEGTDHAMDTLRNIMNPVEAEFDLRFSGHPETGGIVDIRCRRGGRVHRIKLQLDDLSDAGLRRAYQPLDAAIIQMCDSAPPMS